MTLLCCAFFHFQTIEEQLYAATTEANKLEVDDFVIWAQSGDYQLGMIFGCSECMLAIPDSGATTRTGHDETQAPQVRLACMRERSPAPPKENLGFFAMKQIFCCSEQQKTVNSGYISPETLPLERPLDGRETPIYPQAVGGEPEEFVEARA